MRKCTQSDNLLPLLLLCLSSLWCCQRLEEGRREEGHLILRERESGCLGASASFLLPRRSPSPVGNECPPSSPAPYPLLWNREERVFRSVIFFTLGGGRKGDRHQAGGRPFVPMHEGRGGSSAGLPDGVTLFNNVCTFLPKRREARL